MTEQVHNIYSAPETDPDAKSGSDSGLKSVGVREVEVYPESDFSGKCAICGVETCEADYTVTKKLYCCNPFVYLLVLATPYFKPTPIFLACLYFLLRKKMVITYSLCPTHRKQVKRKNLFFMILFPVALAAMLIGHFLWGSSYMIWISLGIMYILVLLHMITGWRLAPTKYKKGVFHVKGFGPKMLEYFRSQQR